MEEDLLNYLSTPLDPISSVLRCKDTYKKLESSIFNYVSLGQWEAARASVSCLALSDDQDTRDVAKELLKILILESSNFWSESAAIPSPHHLSLLALEAYNTFFPDNSLPEYIKKLIEFRLLLYWSKGLISFSSRVASTLCSYHAFHVLRIPGSSSETTPQLSSLLLSFLHDVITILDPSLGHTFIKSLTIPSTSSQYIGNNESLQLVYVDCINECLEVLDSLRVSAETENDSDSQYESDQPSGGVRFTGSECERAMSMVYTLLSMIDGTPEMMRLMKKVDTVFHTLLQASYTVTSSGPPRTFDVGRIYSCLLGRSSTFLIRRLHEVEEFLRVNRLGEESQYLSSTSALSPINRRPHSITKIEEEEIGVTDGKTRSQSARYEQEKDVWKNRFYDAVYDHKHVLESVLDRGLQLIYTGKLQELSHIMIKPEFIPLRPVLLLLGWDRYAATGSGKELLDALWPMDVSIKQVLMFSGCCKLAFQVELVQWCLDKARPHIQSPLTITFHRAGDMFKGLKNHSTLYVLHHSTPLGSLDPLEVVDILKMRPRIPSRSSILSPPPQFSRGTTPMKIESESSPAPLGSRRLFSALRQTALKPEQERDIAIFKSFCTLKLIFDAIWSSIKIRNGIVPEAVVPSTRESSEKDATDITNRADVNTGTQAGGTDGKPSRRTQKGATKAARKLELGSEGMNSSLQDENFSDVFENDVDAQISRLYRNHVTDRLQESRIYLANIFPLNFRLEVLENVFSLLFLTSEDVSLLKSGEDDQAFTKSFLSAPKIGNVSSFIALIKSKNEFLMDERLTSEILDILQDCIRELRASKYALTQQSEPPLGEASALTPDAVKSSISDIALNSRTSKLEQNVNEAKWRLQMVSSKHGITSSKGGGLRGRGGGGGPPLTLSARDQGISDGEFDTDSESSLDYQSESERESEGRRGRKKQQRKKSSAIPTATESTRDDENESLSSFSLSLKHPIRSASLSRTTTTSSNGQTGVTFGGNNSKGSSPTPSSSSNSIRASTPVHTAATTTTIAMRRSPVGRKSFSKQNSASSVASGVAASLETYRDDDSGDCADGEERSPVIHASKRKKRFKSRNRGRNKRYLGISETSSSSPPDAKMSRGSIICRMLASPGSLIRMCLKHSNYMRANEVLKTLHMEGEFGEALIQFSERYEAVSQELIQQSRNSAAAAKRSGHTSASSSHSHSTHLSHSNTPPQPLQPNTAAAATTTAPGGTEAMSYASNMSLQVAIMNATSSFNPLQCVHQLLAPSSIHQVLFSGDLEMEKMAQESDILRRLMKHVPSLIMLDMVCCSKINGHIAKQLLEMALDRLQNDRSFQSDANGPLVLLNLMSSMSRNFLEPYLRPQQGLVPHYHTCPHSILTYTTHALTPLAMSQMRLFVDTYRESREKLESEMDVSQREISASSSSQDIFSQLSQLVAVSGVSPPLSSYLRTQTPSNGSIFDELVRALHSIPPDHTLYPMPSQEVLQPPGTFQSRGLMESNVVSFLWQFSRYISKLIELLIKCLGIKTSGLTKGSLVLSVLRESPSQTLGRLIFEKGVHPHKLEGLMGDFPHLRIVEVLVKCCCPQIVSHAFSSPAGLSSPIVSLNSGECSSSEIIPDPSAFSYHLLDQLLTSLKKLSAEAPTYQDHPGTLSPKDLACAYRNPQIQKVLSKTPSLASIDLTLLGSLTKKMIFYTNITNLLYLHTVLRYCAEACSSPEGTAGGLGETPSTGGRGEGVVSLSMLESSKVIQTVFFMKFGYRIGQLGLISCHDLHHAFLRQGLTPHYLVKGDKIQSRLKLTHPDTWVDYAPPASDPRLFYVINDGHMTGPCPSPLSIENFESALLGSERRYLNSTIQVDVAKRVVSIPKPLYNIKNDFRSLLSSSELSTTPSNPSHSQSRSQDIFFLKYVQPNLDEAQADILLTLIDANESAKSKKLHLSKQPENIRIGYDLGSMLSNSSGGGGNSGGSPKGRRKRISRESSRRDLLSPGTEDRSVRSIQQHSFTVDTFEFVKKQAPLLAGLVILLCPLKLPTDTLASAGSGNIEAASTTSGTGGGGGGGAGGEEDKDVLIHTEKEEAKSFMQNLRSKVTSPVSIPPPLSSTTLSSSSSSLSKSTFIRRLSIPYEDRDTVTPWKNQYDDIIAHFSTNIPMKNFLASRLSGFAELIPWDEESRIPLPSSSSSSSAIKRSLSSFPDSRDLHLRQLAFASPSSDELGRACIFVMKMLMESGRIGDSVLFLSSEPAINHLHEVQFFSETALSCLFVENYKDILATEQNSVEKTVFKNPIPVLSRLLDPELASRLALSSLHIWPVDICVDMLSYCLHHLSSDASSGLATPLSHKLDRMRVYSTIMSKCERAAASTITTTSSYLGRSPWKDWVALARESAEKTGYVLSILLESKEFDLARKWCSVHGLSAEIARRIEVEYIFDLLEGEIPNSILAHQKLDGLLDAKTSLEVCEAILHEKKKKAIQPEVEMTSADLNTVIFILQYMLTRLRVSIGNKPEYYNRLLGAKALLCLPQSSYEEYKKFVQHPLLLVEQLIMDLKIGSAAGVIRQLRSNKLLYTISTNDMPILDHTPMIRDEEGGSSDPFSTVLMFYSSRALDFPQPVLIQSTPMQTPGVTSGSTTTGPPSPVNHPAGTGTHFSQTSAPGGGGGGGVGGGGHRFDDYGQYPSMTPRGPPMFKTRNRAGSTTTTAGGGGGGSDSITTATDTFQPPDEPPPKEKWEKDDETKICRICSVHFGMFMRRHHCRRCGRVVCAGCSSHVDTVEGYNRAVRVCTTCHGLFSPQNSPGENNPASSTRLDGNFTHQDMYDQLEPVVAINQIYKLIPADLMYNQKIRSEFYYERTPNTALCLSLADLLVDKRQAAGMILDCCHSVSAQLVPDSQGRVNEEVDHHFVIDLIQKLLRNAKLRFADASDSSGVELCDTYLSRVDLLRLLVTSRYNKIPSIQELTKPDLARRVRDRLIRDDRFVLAMEVSTKCQLDSSAVWSAWGMTALKSGNFSLARDKLKHCFQVSSHSKLLGSSGQNMHLLQRIVEQIEQNPLSVASKLTRLSDDWSGVVLGSSAITERRQADCDLDNIRFNECIYYLRTYGSHSSTVAFLVRHSCLREACNFIIDNSCSGDVFVEHLWVPVMKSGQADQTMSCMRDMDPSLGLWDTYLTAACRFFSKKSLFSVLLRTQLYMNDFVRAALTSIKFFVGFAGRATTISDLYGRLHYLDQASKHFRTALEKIRGRGTRSRGQRVYEDLSRVGGQKAVNVPELQSHLVTISLQNKVIHHLYHSAKAMNTLHDPLATPSGGGASPRSLPHSSFSPSAQQPATLFRNASTREEVAVQVLTCSHDLAEGFTIATEIIETYKLNSRRVYCETSQGLAVKQRYGDVRTLVQSIQQSYQGKSYSWEALNDDIIMAAVKVLASGGNQTREAKQVDKLVQMLTSDRSKIKALVQCGKLKSAYLIAIRTKLVDEVQRISEIAGKAGHTSVRDICEKWLQSNAPY